MNIALIHSNFTRGGGMEAYMLALIKGFHEQNDKVSVYACKMDNKLAQKIGCTVHQIKPFLPRKMREFRFLHRCNLLPIREQYDLSLATCRTSSTHVAVCGGVHAATIGSVYRTSLLHTFHDRKELFYEQKTFADSHHIMAHSGAIAQQILQHYPDSGAKIKVLYPPIDTDRFQPSFPTVRQATRSLLSIDDQRLSFLFVSCGHQRKGLEELMQAFANLDPKRYELLVAGSAIPAAHPANIRHIGYINDLAPIYSAVDFTILPSHYEPFGLVIPESLQCGTPVIVTQNVGAAELLTDQEAVFLADNRAETIAATIKGLSKTFAVEPDFALRHKLDIAQHLNEIKRLFC